MRFVPLAFVAAMLAGPALAQQPGVPAPEAVEAAPSPDDPRVNQLIIYGDDPCPRGADDEIIVCARLPEDDRFRIPPVLRNNPNDPASQSWANRAVELSYVGRTGIGSCSTVGGGGTAGCFNQIVQQARAERRGDERVNWDQLIEQAREERMRRIGEAVVEEEEDQANRPR